MKRFEPLSLLIVGTIVLLVSAIDPYDRITWWLEVFPILIGVPILMATYHRFRFTPLAYRLVFIHALILMLGAHYTYARVPLGFWLQQLLDLSRNHYDRLGHFAQGFIPAILAREILLRQTPLVSGKWLFFIVASICLALSACYEFTEWWAALAGGEAADAFLGTQGDVWDTQWDMFLALLGAISAQILLAHQQDRELGRLESAKQES